MAPEPLLPIWRVSAAWAAKQHECTLAGILKRCAGRCCYGPTFWPARAYDIGPLHACGNLGEHGCVLSPADKPVVCLLYPLKVNANNTLVLHAKAALPSGPICRGNHGEGPPLIVALEPSLTELFGAEQYARVRADVLAGRDSYFWPSEAVLAAAEAEGREAERETCLPRPEVSGHEQHLPERPHPRHAPTFDWTAAAAGRDHEPTHKSGGRLPPPTNRRRNAMGSFHRIGDVHHIYWEEWEAGDEHPGGIDLHATLGSTPISITLSNDQVAELLPQVTEMLRQLGNDHAQATAALTAATTR
jgi:hypothetical protein